VDDRWLVRAKQGREFNLYNQSTIIVVSNRLSLLSLELKSKAGEFPDSGTRDAGKQENLNPELADEVARQLNGHTHDVRDTIRVARLDNQIGVTPDHPWNVRKTGDLSCGIQLWYTTVYTARR